MNNDKRIVVQFSGGIESTVLVATAIRDVGKENVFLIGFDDTTNDTPNLGESFAFKRVTDYFKLPNAPEIVKIPNSRLFEYTSDELYEGTGFIPGYKMIMNVVSMAYAQKIRSTEVWVGNMKDNYYPDELPEFNNTLATFYNWAYSNPHALGGKPLDKDIQIITPLLELSKGEVINMSTTLGLDLSITYSCERKDLIQPYYVKNSDTLVNHCGICPWCLKRRTGFLESDVSDPTNYINHNNNNSYIDEISEVPEDLCGTFKNIQRKLQYPNFIICSAIKFDETIITGVRHWDQFMRTQLHELTNNNVTVNKANQVQGFLDINKKFVTREDALKIVIDNNQTFDVKRNGSITELFSEGIFL